MLRRFVLALVLALLAAPAGAGERTLPRFASLGAGEVNLRAGPGTQFPVAWVLTRRHLPAEVLAEYGQWRKVREPGGSVGWVHKSLLSAARWVIVVGAVRTIRAAPTAAAAAVARAEPGVIARLLACHGPWCRIAAGDAEGWLRRTAIWGVYPDETVE